MIIYKSTNKINNKIYVGQTTISLEKRIKNHIRESKKNTNRPFLNSLKKYGIDNFLFEIIDSANNLEELNDKEIYWINKLNSLCPNGYNITGGGQGKRLISTDEFSKSISEGLKNSEKWQKLIKDEEFLKNRKDNFIYSNKGKKFSKEHKDKIWESNKDRILEHNKNTSKKWIIVDKNNNIQRILGKEEYFNNLGLDSDCFSRMSKKLNENKKIKRYNGYYCFIDNGENDEIILSKVLELDNIFNSVVKLYNKNTSELKIIKKSDLYFFCKENNYDFLSFLKMTKGKSKSYKGWIIKD